MTEVTQQLAEALASSVLAQMSLFPLREHVASATAAAVDSLPAETASVVRKDLPGLVDAVWQCVKAGYFAADTPPDDSRLAHALEDLALPLSATASHADAAHVLLRGPWTPRPSAPISDESVTWTGPLTSDSTAHLGSAVPLDDQPWSAVLAAAATGALAGVALVVQLAARVDAGDVDGPTALAYIVANAPYLRGPDEPATSDPALAAACLSLLRAATAADLAAAAASDKSAKKIVRKLELALARVKAFCTAANACAIAPLALATCGVSLDTVSAVAVDAYLVPLLLHCAETAAPLAHTSYLAFLAHIVAARLLASPPASGSPAASKAALVASSQATASAQLLGFDLRARIFETGIPCINAVSPMRVEAQLLSAEAVSFDVMLQLVDDVLDA
ncbi:uncharacterized protein AMSG_00262 [Thecamonas trahens ATCC 50062]|uniref:Uncharacterized protein n=1 Tax=Thecamonas trahens ATCC 50062 TaxID=461836 RepID=A0A0L0D1B3_THETB|nr:hypothetical protein AMSG_00262 [Thecamonas trahens ATCC 50062]KNC46144.1 hypothetical protein AMSG_00262 [Thecamonas trahens ATCC 50062]|eukprot:XP_013763121.1 hypothetical protein AMSG_00262 [Thecamonas trahens ATCC 50062]